jgi:hypothetical protein
MAEYAIPLMPFDVPTKVKMMVPTSGRREDGFKPLPELNLSDLPRATVEQLCAEFTSAVMAAYDQARPLYMDEESLARGTVQRR